MAIESVKVYKSGQEDVLASVFYLQYDLIAILIDPIFFIANEWEFDS